MDNWDAWIGREQRQHDRLTDALAARFRATLGIDGQLGLHWCLCTPETPTEALGPDGHPPRGDFLPPLPQPRRMWAGSELAFHRPIQAGERVERVSRIAAIEQKTGASGPLAFVTVAHEVRAEGALAVEERQTLVYREAGNPAPRRVAKSEPWERERTLVPSPVLLFRYSALTFNSHRIHYDLPYARDAEGYDGLVVHGPLTATLLLDLAVQHAGEAGISGFAFRAEAPAYAGRDLTLRAAHEGGQIRLGAFDADGVRVMQAAASVRP